MRTSNHRRTELYYDSIAAEYDAQMEAVPFNRWVREAFRDLITSTTPPPAFLLDYGCGTGIDTAWLAGRGYQVIAYDESSGMIRELRRKCADFIDCGQVVVSEGSFQDLIDTLKGRPALDAVIGNFAVLNLIRDPQPVFGGLAPHVRAGGHVLVSVLNPFFWKDLRSGAFWLAWLRSIGQPAIHVSGQATDVYRHRIRALRRAAHPYFRLTGRASVGALIRRFRGPRTWREPRTIAERIETLGWTTFPLTHLGEFIFLSLRREA